MGGAGVGVDAAEVLLLVAYDFEFAQPGLSESGSDGDVGRIASGGHEHAAHAG